MILRAPEPDDAPDIMRIVRQHGLPREWVWPEGLHGVVAATNRVVAFCILRESIYGLVVEELWQEDSRDGQHGLTLLSRHIEAQAQRLADQRGSPLMCGGIVRLDRQSHINALRKRGYTDCATILQKEFLPKAVAEAIEERVMEAHVV